VLGKTFDALAFALLFTVETLRVELVAKSEGFHLAVQTWEVRFCGCREIKPARASGLSFEL
jgi:hypothetical protein